MVHSTRQVQKVGQSMFSRLTWWHNYWKVRRTQARKVQANRTRIGVTGLIQDLVSMHPHQGVLGAVSERVEGWRLAGAARQRTWATRSVCVRCVRAIWGLLREKQLDSLFPAERLCQVPESPCYRPSLSQRHGGATGQRALAQGMQDLITWVVRATAAPQRKLQQSASRIRTGPS